MDQPAASHRAEPHARAAHTPHSHALGQHVAAHARPARVPLALARATGPALAVRPAALAKAAAAASHHLGDAPVEATHGVLGAVAVVLTDVTRELLRCVPALGTQQDLDACSQTVGGQFAVRHRLRSRTGGVYGAAPEGLVAKERHYHGGPPVQQPDGCGARPAVVDDGCHLGEQPVVRRVFQKEDAFRHTFVVVVGFVGIGTGILRAGPVA